MLHRIIGLWLTARFWHSGAGSPILSWLVVEPYPLKNDGVKVSWDDEIPIWKNRIHVPNHQPVEVECQSGVILEQPEARGLKAQRNPIVVAPFQWT